MPQWTLTHTGIDQVHSEFGKGHQHFNNFTSAIVDQAGLSEHVIMSKYFIRSIIFGILALHTNRKRCGQMESTPR